MTVLEVTTVDPTSVYQVGEVGGNRQKGRRSPLTGRSCKFPSVIRKPDSAGEWKEAPSYLRLGR